MGLTTSEISRRELGLEFADDLWFQAAIRACGAGAGDPAFAPDEPAPPMVIPGGPPGGRHMVAPCPIHNTVQIDLVSGAHLCPCCCVVGDSSAWTVKVQRPSYHAMHVHLKEGAEATARERFWAEADRGSHVELLHGDRVVRSVQVDAEGRTLHLPTDERARAQPGIDPNHYDEALMGATMPEQAAPLWLIEAMRRGFSDVRLAPRDCDDSGAADDCCADGEQADEQAEGG
jgi:hypothetical protein